MRKDKKQHPQRPLSSSVLKYLILRAYRKDPTMSETLREFYRHSIDKLLDSLPAEERLKGLPAEERLKGLSAEELVRALPPEVLEALARTLKANGSSSKEE